MKPLLFLSGLAGLLLAPACQRHAPPVPDSAALPEAGTDRVQLPRDGSQQAALKVEPVTPCTVTLTHLNGRLLWDEDLTVRLYTPLAGSVTRIDAEVGHVVRKGEVLAWIASPDFGQAQADARRAAADFALAERNLTRLRELLAHGAAALKDLHAAEADFDRAQSEKQRTAARLEFFGGRSDRVDQVYELRSPLDGVVVERNINPGQEVRPDQMLANAPQFFAPLFVITDPTRLWVQLDATEQDLPQLKVARSMMLRTRAYPSRDFDANIDWISDSIDPVSRTVKIRGSVQNPERLLKAEMFVTADVQARAENASNLDVSSKAVFFKRDKHFVFLEERPGSYQIREVRVGPEHDGKIVVLEGLQPGQRVVTEGSLLLDQVLQDRAGS